jgi:RNA polymerase sigma-70 factor (ECF subfamily)
VPAGDATNWTLIRRAASGQDGARERFARHYGPTVRAYLGARWRGSPLLDELDDAAQEVFFECFRDDGALARADPARGSGFRAYFFGVVRNVARRVERMRVREREVAAGGGTFVDRVDAREEDASIAFERAWARAVMREAGELLAGRAHLAGEEAVRRVELLRLRFQEGRPIREIARRWGADPTHLHRESARARREFHRALRDVVAQHEGGSASQVDAACRRLLTALA